MSPTRLVSIGLAALLGLARPAGAHDFWIEPSSYRPAAGSVLRVHLRVGGQFEGDLVPRRDELIERFELQTPSRRVPVSGVDGVNPAGWVTIDGPGTYTLSYQSRGSRVELPSDRFESYLREEGLERVIERRAARGASGTVGRERFFRCAKSLVLAGGGSFQPAARSGLTLELVPRFDPTRVHPGEPLPVTLLFRGRPIEGARVTLLAKGDPFEANAQRTDRRGEATLTSTAGGPYLLKAVWMEPAAAGSDVDWESWWASLDFDVTAAR
jgi:hypothetical protein